MKPILLRIPEAHIEALDKLVSEGFYPNRNEAIRFAIHDLLAINHKKRIVENESA